MIGVLVILMPLDNTDIVNSLHIENFFSFILNSLLYIFHDASFTDGNLM